MEVGRAKDYRFHCAQRGFVLRSAQRTSLASFEVLATRCSSVLRTSAPTEGRTAYASVDSPSPSVVQFATVCIKACQGIICIAAFIVLLVCPNFLLTYSNPSHLLSLLTCAIAHLNRRRTHSFSSPYTHPSALFIVPRFPAFSLRIVIYW